MYMYMHGWSRCSSVDWEQTSTSGATGDTEWLINVRDRPACDKSFIKTLLAYGFEISDEMTACLVTVGKSVDFRF